MDFMSFSYSARETLSRISSAILRSGKAGTPGAGKPRQVSDTDPGLSCGGRSAAHASTATSTGSAWNTLLHNNLRCMYWGSFSQNMAERFVKRAFNKSRDEFWTPFPLPSVAVNDPLYDNASDNCWGGQPQGLTWQRAIRALENYGYHPLVARLGYKLFEALQADCVFPQQFDPWTGRRQGERGRIRPH